MRALRLAFALALAATAAGCEGTSRFSAPERPAPRAERPDPLMPAPTGQVEQQELPPPKP